MKRKPLLLLLAATAALLSPAAPVTVEQARDIAGQFMLDAARKNPKFKGAAGARPEFRVVYTAKNKTNGDNQFYVFNRGEGDGFILVSADDRVPQIIGYSDSGSFDVRHLPGNMKAWLDGYAEQISYIQADEDGATAFKASAKEGETGEVILPLLGTTAWDQLAPYNGMCPVVNDYDNDYNGKAATGCVSTALSQVMYHHRWPINPTGSVSYTTDYLGVQVNATFDGTTYDWENMLPVYDSSASQASKDAVAQLMFHVGASLKSDYGASTGATDISICPALMSYFGYDQGINYVQRDYHTTADWNDMIMEELRANRPVPYGGVTRRREGHYFVLDGVDADGLYHVNWGWSGEENGYYRLTLLEPGSQGTGGASSGTPFHFAQNMIIGMQKPVAGSKKNYTYTCSFLNTYNKTIGRNETAKLTTGEVWNYSTGPVSAKIGYFLINSEEEVVYRHIIKTVENQDIAYGWGDDEYEEEGLSAKFLIPDNIPNGDYTIRVGYQIGEENYETDHFALVKPGQNNEWHVSVSDEQLVYSTVGASATSMLELTTDSPDGVIDGRYNTRYTVKMHNDGGEYFGEVQLRFFIDGKDKVYGRFDLPAQWVTIPANSDVELTFEGILDCPGHTDYVCRLIEAKSKSNLGQLKNITIEGNPLPAVLALSDDMIITTMENGVVPVNNIGLKALIENEGGRYEGIMTARLSDPDDWWGDDLAVISFNPVVIEAESETWINLTGGKIDESLIEFGKTYELTLDNPVDDETMIPNYYCTVELEFGEAITVAEPVLELESADLYPAKPRRDQDVTLSFQIRNTGSDYADNVNFILFRKGNEETPALVSESKLANVPADGSVGVEYVQKLDVDPADDYVIRLLDKDAKTIGEINDVEILDKMDGLEAVDNAGFAVNVDGENVYISGEDSARIEIYNVAGTLVAMSDANVLSIANLPAGVYIIRAESVCSGIRFVKFIR